MTLKVGDLIPIGGSGNVKPSEVLEGKRFSSDEGTDLVGTMKNRDTLEVKPSKTVARYLEGHYSSVTVNPITEDWVKENYPQITTKKFEYNTTTVDLVNNSIFFSKPINIKNVLCTIELSSKYLQPSKYKVTKFCKSPVGFLQSDDNFDSLEVESNDFWHEGDGYCRRISITSMWDETYNFINFNINEWYQKDHLSRIMIYNDRITMNEKLDNDYNLKIKIIVI